MFTRYWMRHTTLLALLIFFVIIGLPTLLVAFSPLYLQTTSKASLRLSPPSTLLSVNEASIPLDIYLAPESNNVSFVQLELLYDPTVFTVDAIPFVVDTQSHLTIHEGPYSFDGKILVSLSSFGRKIDKAEKHLGTLLHKPINNSPNVVSSSIRFGTLTNVQMSEKASSKTIPTSFSPAHITVASR